jgi:FKBP-type peptidyl-prolyl cis-trans isomerase
MRWTSVLLLLVIVIVSCNKKTAVLPTAQERLASDLQMIDEYLAAHNVKAVRFDSIRYAITELGTGPTVEKLNCIRFRYEGYELNSDVPFETSTDAGIKAPYKSLIGGMQIALKHMPVGTKGSMYLPSLYAYGASAKYNTDGTVKISANAILRFENVEILELYDYNQAGNYCY